MAKTYPDLLKWLHRLDAYTNAVLGRARTLSALREACVACDEVGGGLDARGVCGRCARQRVGDNSEVALFRPLRQPRE
jgi:hypothetical protein